MGAALAYARRYADARLSALRMSGQTSESPEADKQVGGQASRVANLED
jgi:hypothetical protein